YLLDWHALGDQKTRFAQVRAENSRTVKARAITNHDHRFALTLAEFDDAGDHSRQRVIGDHDLEQGRPVGGGKVVHAKHLLGPARERCDWLIGSDAVLDAKIA